MGFEAEVDCDLELSRFPLTFSQITPPIAFRAAQAYKRYHQAGGVRTNVLPDFWVGAHARSLGPSLQTRDVKRHRTYFPGVILLAP